MPQTENIVFQVQFMQMEPKECTSPVSEDNSAVESTGSHWPVEKYLLCSAQVAFKPRDRVI